MTQKQPENTGFASVYTPAPVPGAPAGLRAPGRTLNRCFLVSRWCVGEPGCVARGVMCPLTAAGAEAGRPGCAAATCSSRTAATVGANGATSGVCAPRTPPPIPLHPLQDRVSPPLLLRGPEMWHCHRPRARNATGHREATAVSHLAPEPHVFLDFVTTGGTPRNPPRRARGPERRERGGWSGLRVGRSGVSRLTFQEKASVVGHVYSMMVRGWSRCSAETRGSRSAPCRCQTAAAAAAASSGSLAGGGGATLKAHSAPCRRGVWRAVEAQNGHVFMFLIPLISPL